MGSHIMKTTIEIADDLFERAQRLARKEKTTFRSLTEQGLRMVLKEKQTRPAKWKWKPVTFKGSGLTDLRRPPGSASGRPKNIFTFLQFFLALIPNRVY